jgi:hypothetical protein
MSALDIVPEGKKNVGGYDRLARAAGGVFLLAVAAAVYASGGRVAAVVALVAAAGLFVNAATQFCGINAVLGVDTCSRGADGECQN